MLHEVQFDGLVGPTHNYAGLSSGNVASTTHGGQQSRPKQAALQGLTKMRFVHALGIEQAFLPPLARPDIAALRAAGGHGTDAELITSAGRDNPALLAQVSSASSMWTANAATIAPSCDTADATVHVTPANLISKVHRALEPPQTATLLRTALPFATHHDPLPADAHFSDEGAANHTRLHTGQGTVHLFVFGTDPDNPNAPAPLRYQARQSALASATIAHHHQLADDTVVLAQQHPDVIDAGVFHNDVISVGSGNVLLLHAAAFLNTDQLLEDLSDRLGSAFTPLLVTAEQLSVEDAVRTYLFNSQLLELPDGGFTLLCPIEVEKNAKARAVVDGWCSGDTPIADVHYLNLRESMHNGGGPACLRLRVPLSEEECEGIHPGLRITPERLDDLADWIERWYPDTLAPADLADPGLLETSRTALADLTDRCGLGDLYPFQQHH